MFDEERIITADGGDAAQKVVYLIGDSIRMGYCEAVKQELADVADVIYPEENCRFTQYVIAMLRTWSGLCDPQRVAVVQFNCGHWDVAHWNGEASSLNSPAIYRENICRIANALKELYPNARIVFATTTPMNPNGENSPNGRTTQEIMRYNEEGVAAARACGIEVNDLFAYTKDWPAECYLDYCHFAPQHAASLGRHVAHVLRGML